MQARRTTAAAPGAGQEMAYKYRHLPAVYLPYPGLHACRADFNPAALAACQRAWPGTQLQLMLAMPPAAARADAATYHGALLREIGAHGARWNGRACLQQWDFGAAPQALDERQLAQLVEGLRRHFTVASDTAGAFSVTLAAAASERRVRQLRCLGFNQLSIRLGARSGVGRAAALLAGARAAGFRTLQLSLPPVAGAGNAFLLARRLQDAVRLQPDRIAVPGQQLHPLHGRILADGGYVQAGADLFVPELGTLRLSRLLAGQQRHPQGDRRFGGPNLLGIGAGAITAIGASLSQHSGDAADYCRRLAAEASPVARAMVLSRDQLLRRTVMQMLLCEFELSTTLLETLFGIDFARYFAPELATLAAMQRDGLLLWEDGWLSLQRAGWPLARRICSVFARRGELVQRLQERGAHV